MEYLHKFDSSIGKCCCHSWLYDVLTPLLCLKSSCHWNILQSKQLSYVLKSMTLFLVGVFWWVLLTVKVLWALLCSGTWHRIETKTEESFHIVYKNVLLVQETEFWKASLSPTVHFTCCNLKEYSYPFGDFFVFIGQCSFISVILKCIELSRHWFDLICRVFWYKGQG